MTIRFDHFDGKDFHPAIKSVIAKLFFKGSLAPFLGENFDVLIVEGHIASVGLIFGSHIFANKNTLSIWIFGSGDFGRVFEHIILIKKSVGSRLGRCSCNCGHDRQGRGCLDSRRGLKRKSRGRCEQSTNDNDSCAIEHFIILLRLGAFTLCQDMTPERTSALPTA